MPNGNQSRLVKPVHVQVAGESFDAFVPPALPPIPKVDVEPLWHLIERANATLGRLDGLSTVLPAQDIFIYSYIRKEAVLSSQIEGTQSSLSELLLFEQDALPGVPLDDVKEVSNYVAAMEHGLQRLSGGFPLTGRLLKEIHGILLQSGRGNEKAPGEFRRSQNWIGGTRPGNALFVPPPPTEVDQCMGELEKFIHDNTTNLPILVCAGLIHAQFETIHPFLDGNGRLGRLLVTLYLCEKKLLAKPLLYLSLYLKANRSKYYELLQQVRFAGRWEEWLEFFLTGILETAEQAANTAIALRNVYSTDRTTIEGTGRRSASAIRLHNLLAKNIALTINSASRELQLTHPTMQSAFDELIRLKIVREITGRQRNRVFAYDKYLRLLSEGTEPLAVQKQNTNQPTPPT